MGQTVNRKPKTGKFEAGDGAEFKIGILKTVMRKKKLYVLSVSEIRWDGEGVVDMGNDYTMIYKGEGDARGVGIILSPDASKEWRKEGNKAWLEENCVRIQLKTWDVISMYVPGIWRNRQKESEAIAARNECMEKIEGMLQRIPKNRRYIACGDMNVQIGSRQADDPEEV